MFYIKIKNINKLLFLPTNGEFNNMDVIILYLTSNWKQLITITSKKQNVS